MSSGLDLGVTAQHLYAKLTAASGLSGLAVYEGLAPETAADVFVSFEYLAEDRPVTRGTGAIYIFSRPRYKVAATGKDTPYSALRVYAQAIYNALHNTSSTLSGGTCSTLAEAPFQQEDPEEGGVVYRHAGWIVEAYTRSA